MSKPEARKTPGKKMMTTTYKKGGKVKKNMGGAMHTMPNGTMMPGAKHGMMKAGMMKGGMAAHKGGAAHKKKK